MVIHLLSKVPCEPGDYPPSMLNEMVNLRRTKSILSGRRVWMWLAIGMLLLLMAACTPDPNETFIQGSWYYNDQHIQEVVGESYAETIWNFERGRYETKTCCFVKFQQFGRYDIHESEGDKIILEMFNINGKFNSERFQLGILIDRDKGTINIGSTGPFTRTLP